MRRAAVTWGRQKGCLRGAKMVMSNQGKWDVLFCGIAAYLDVLVDVYLFELD